VCRFNEKGIEVHASLNYACIQMDCLEINEVQQSTPQLRGWVRLQARLAAIGDSLEYPQVRPGGMLSA